jgi:hypothetical protein
VDKILKHLREGLGAVNRIIAGVVLFVMAIGTVPAVDISGMGLDDGFNLGIFDYQFERADRETTPAQWMAVAREGVSFAVSAWERYAAELFSDTAMLALTRKELAVWSEDELQRRYAAYLAEQFFLVQTEKMRDETRKSIRDANLALLYEHDEYGNVKTDEKSGDPVIRYDPESFEEDLFAWREKAIAGGEGVFESLFPELMAYINENELSETAIFEMTQYAEIIQYSLINEFNRELAREETLFVARRTLDVYSLRNKSDNEAAAVISRELIAETEYVVAQGIAALEERINALNGETTDLDIGGFEWLEEYRVQFERGLQAWEDAEKRFFIRRVEWEQETGMRYEEGETAWAEAFQTLQIEQQKWAVKTEELFLAGEQLFINAEAELREAIHQAKEEYDRDALERREAGSVRAGVYLEMYLMSGTVVSAAVENIRFWTENINKKEYPSVGSAEFDTWIKTELDEELAALKTEYEKTNTAQRDKVLGALAELEPQNTSSVTVKAALEKLYQTVITENDENKIFVEEMIRRMNNYYEIELWSDLYKTYMEKAKEARTSLLNDFDLVIGKDAGGLIDVLNDTFSSEDFFLDEYQVELIRAEAVKNYWDKRQKIAEAVSEYANLATGDRTTAGSLAASWENAKSNYNTALEAYRSAQSRLTEEGAKILDAHKALDTASAALSEANAELSKLYDEYGELMAVLMSDGSSFFAYEFSNAYKALIENNKTIRETGAEAVYTSYLGHAARYYDEAALDRASTVLKKIVTDLTSDKKNYALSLLMAASLEKWYYDTLEREPPAEDTTNGTIRERLEQEYDEKKEAVALEKIKRIHNEDYDANLIEELDATITVLGTMIETLDYVGNASNAVRNYNGERAVENIRGLYTEWGLVMDGYLLPSPRETAQTLIYAAGDVAQNIVGFLNALDKEFALLPDFLLNEAQSWKNAFIEYLAVKMKDAGIQAKVNEAEARDAINAGLEKIEAAENTNQFLSERDREGARYLCAVIDLGMAFPPFSLDDLKKEAAKRIALELVALYTEDERQDVAAITDTLKQFKQSYDYADESVWTASLERAATKIIEQENIRLFEGVTTYAQENTLSDYEKEVIDTRVFLEESGLIGNVSSLYTAIPQLAALIIEVMEQAAADSDPAEPPDTSGEIPVDPDEGGEGTDPAEPPEAPDPLSEDPVEGGEDTDLVEPPETADPAEPDFTEIKECLAAWKNAYGTLFAIPSRILAYTLAGKVENAADLEKVLTALDLDVYESAETIGDKVRQENFDLMNSVLHFPGNDQTVSALIESIILARLKFFAYTEDQAGFEAELAAAELSGMVTETALLFKDTIDKGARYYGYEISGDLFEWASKTQDGNVEKAVELANWVIMQNWGDAFFRSLTGNEAGQVDYFCVALREAVNSHIQTLGKEVTRQQNILSLALARDAADKDVQNLVANGKEHWRYYLTEPITEGNGIFTKYNDGVTKEDEKLKPGNTDITDEPGDDVKGAKTMIKGFLIDAFERFEFESSKLVNAFLYYDTIKNTNPLTAYADTVRSYKEDKAWNDEDLRPSDYQYTELYQSAVSDMNSHFYMRDFLQSEIGKHGAAIILAKQDDDVTQSQINGKLLEITAQKERYAAMLTGMNGTAAAFEETGREYEAAYQASKEAFNIMEDKRFEYEKQDAIKQWAGTAYLASDGEDTSLDGESQYRNPAAELAYSGERLRNATAALDALTSLYDGDEKERAYQDREYKVLYDKYKVSFSRMMTAIKTSTALNKAIAEETAKNQSLYSDYRSSLFSLTGGINHEVDFSELAEETEALREGGTKVTEYHTINNFITVENDKLAFHFASGNSFAVTVSGEDDWSRLTKFLTPQDVVKSDETTPNEANKVSDFEFSVRELTTRLAARYTGSAGFSEMALAREYLLRKITENSQSSEFNESQIEKYGWDQTIANEHGAIGAMDISIGRKVYESAESAYERIEKEQSLIWNNLSAAEREDIEFWTILTLMNGEVPNSFSKTDTKVYERLQSTAQNNAEGLQIAAIVFLVSAELLWIIPGGQIPAGVYLAASLLLLHNRDVIIPARDRLGTASGILAENVDKAQNAVFTNFADIDAKLKAYHESCDRLADLIGEAKKGETAGWELMHTSLTTAGIEEATICDIKAIWTDVAADGTWESKYASAAEALEGTVSWARREKENTQRSIEDEWAGDERNRQEAEAAYREVYDRYISGEANLSELKESASGTFGNEAAAQKKLFSDIAGVTMTNFEGVTIDGSAFGGEYVALAQDYLGLIGRAYAVRYNAEWTARSAEWEVQLSDIWQKRASYRESAQLIQQRGLADWDAGMKNILSAYNEWRNKFINEYERVSGNWDAAYLAGLLEKEEWVQRATEAATDASKAALFSMTGTENSSRVWDTYLPGGMLINDAVSESRGILADTLGSAGIAGLENIFRTISGSAATTATQVQRGLSVASVLDTGRTQAAAAILARDARETLSEREMKRIAEMVQLAAEEAVKGLKDSLEAANRSFDKSMDDTFKLHGQWMRDGSTYRKDVIVHSTLFDAAVTEKKTVEAYQYYTKDIELTTDIAPDRLGKLDSFSVQALIAKLQQEVDGISATIFGKPDDDSDIEKRTEWIDVLKSEQVQVGTQKRTIGAKKDKRSIEVPIFETRDVVVESVKRVKGKGEFGGHIGYQSVAREDADTNMSMGEYFQGSPVGEQGRLMEYFEYYQAVEGNGIAKMGMAPWDKSLWDDRDSWFKAPTLRGLTDLAVTVALGPAGGGIGALISHAAVGLIDDAVFGIMDGVGGYKGWDEVGVEFGKKVLTTAASTGLSIRFSGANAAIKGMAAGVDKTISQMAVGFMQGTYNSLASSAVNSITYSAKDGFGFSSDGFGKSVMSGLASSLVQATQTATSGLIDIGIEGLTDDALGDTSAMSNFVGGLAGQGVNVALGGDFTLNVLNLGFLAGKEDSALNRLLSTGLLEMHLGGENGFGMNIGTGGVDASVGNLMAVGRGMATYADVNGQLLASKQKETGEFASAMRTLYSGTAEQRQAFDDALNNKLLLRKSTEKDFKDENDPEKRTLAQTVDNGDGTRTMNIGTAALELGSRMGLNVVFAHEAYRNGKDDGEEGQRAETNRAVEGHVDTALALIAGYGAGSVGGAFMIEAMVYDNARKKNNTETISKIQKRYDSSADYWRLRSVLDDDGNVVSYSVDWDDSLDLTIENADGTTTEIKAGQIQNEGLNDISQWFSNNGLAFDDKLKDGFVSLGKASEATQTLMDTINKFHTNKVNDKINNAFKAISDNFLGSIGTLIASGLQIGGLGDLPDQSKMYSLMPGGINTTTLFGERLVTEELKRGGVTGDLYDWATYPHHSEDISAANGSAVQTPTAISGLSMGWSLTTGFGVAIDSDNGYRFESNHLDSASGMNLLKAMLQSGSKDALAAGLQFASVGVTGTATTGPHNHLVGKLNGTVEAPSKIFAAMGIPSYYPEKNTELTGYLKNTAYNDPKLLQDIRNNMSVADRQAYVNAHSELFQSSVEFVNGKSLVKHEFDIVTMSYKTRDIRPSPFRYGIGLESQPSFWPGR